MATVHTSFQALLISLSIITCILLSLTTATPMATFTSPRPLVIKLIHRDSIFSPYYNPEATIEERAQRAIDNTRARAAYLQERIKRTGLGTDDYRAPLIANNAGSEFLANISIGHPPHPQLLDIDTASDLLWLQCQPCINCVAQSVPIFDPSKSSTYVNLTCTSPRCLSKCNSSAQFCEFEIYYSDGSISAGNLASEELTFKTSDDGLVTVPIERFGCAHNTNGAFDGQESGIFGLGGGEKGGSGFIAKHGSKFSYCVGNIKDPHYIHNQLIIGDGSKLEGYTTPLEVFGSTYYLTLEGISVGDKKLEIDPGVFKRKPTGEGGVIIDSGAQLMYLFPDVYKILRHEVRRVIGGKLREVQDPRYPLILCYNSTRQRELSGTPLVTLHFAQEADMVLDYKSMFYQATQEVLCMAAMTDDTISVIGVMAQQFHNIGYDLIGGKLYLQRIDCSRLNE